MSIRAIINNLSLPKLKFKRFAVYIAAFLGSVAVVAAAYLYKNRESRSTYVCKGCNVVVIDIDILRTDALDCEKYYDRTPNICGFFKNSIVFRNHISQSFFTFPSFVSFMTSLYPSSHKMWDRYNRSINSNIRHLGDILKDNGYSSNLFWYPTDQILSEWFADEKNYAEGRKDLKNISQQKPFFLYFYTPALHFPYLYSDDEKAAADHTEISAGMIKTYAEWEVAQKDYIVKNYKDVFKPDIRTEHPDIFEGNIESNRDKLYQLYISYAKSSNDLKYLYGEWLVRYNAFVQYIDTSNQNDISYLKSRYAKILAEIDTDLSDLLRFLEQNKANTLVILHTDHGEEFFEHGKFSHQNDLYQELIATPLFIQFPGSTSQYVNRFSQDIDVLPTILDLLDIKIPIQAQGISLLPLIRDPQAWVNQYQIAQQGDWQASFRTGDWKIITTKDFAVEPQLFNLADDPGEKFNLATTSPNMTRLLLNKYQNIISQYPVYDLPQIDYPEGINEEKKQRLKKEGYF